jgi:hypothetical protein
VEKGLNTIHVEQQRRSGVGLKERLIFVEQLRTVQLFIGQGHVREGLMLSLLSNNEWSARRLPAVLGCKYFCPPSTQEECYSTSSAILS